MSVIPQSAALGLKPSDDKGSGAYKNSRRSVVAQYLCCPVTCHSLWPGMVLGGKRTNLTPLLWDSRVAQFDTNSILTALYMVIKYIQT